MSVRDTDRSAVYAAEDGLAAVLRRGGALDFHGSILDLPADQKFVSRDEIEYYVLVTWPRLGMQEPRPSVKHSRGVSKASYSRSTHTIRIPGREWSMRELVVLHELAHAVVSVKHGGVEAAHGPLWREEYVEAVRIMLGDAAALVLRANLYEAVGA